MQWRQANHFFGAFSIFESRGVTKHLMTGPLGNSEFCFPSTSMFPSASPRGTLRVSRKQNSLFPLWPVIECLINLPATGIQNKKLILLLSKGAIALQQTIHIKNCGDSAFVNFSAECDSDKLRQMIDMITYLSEELSRFDVSMQHHPEILYYVITSWQVFKPRRVERFFITLSIACICRPIKFN